MLGVDSRLKIAGLALVCIVAGSSLPAWAESEMERLVNNREDTHDTLWKELEKTCKVIGDNILSRSQEIFEGKEELMPPGAKDQLFSNMDNISESISETLFEVRSFANKIGNTACIAAVDRFKENELVQHLDNIRKIKALPSKGPDEQNTIYVSACIHLGMGPRVLMAIHDKVYRHCYTR